MQKNRLLPKIRALAGLTVLAMLGMSASAAEGLYMTGDASITVNGGASLVVGSLTNTSTGLIKNDGTVEIAGDLQNDGSALFDAASTGSVVFNGTAAQAITGTASVHVYGPVELDNPAGVALTDAATGADATIHGALTFTNGTFTLNGFNLTLGADAVNADAAKYFVTNGAGSLKRSVPADGTTNVVFPVGNSAYNPVTLQNSATATADTYGVKVVDAYPAAFPSADHIVDRSWIITEGTAGGSDLTVTTQWNGTEELTDFDRANAALGQTSDNGANVAWGTPTAATGTNPYALTSGGISVLGTFMVGDQNYTTVIVDLKVYLAGAYNTANHNMDKTLNLNALLPTTSPYDATTVTAVPASAVDWVKIELRNKTTMAVESSFSRFIDQDGQIINENESNCSFPGLARDEYYIAVVHRNHLGVMTANPIDLNAASPAFDFTSGANLYTDAAITTNDPMVAVETGVYALWSGDANGDGQVTYIGGSNDRSAILGVVGITTPGDPLLATYNDADVNMDGNVNYIGAGNDGLFILSTLGASPGSIYYSHLP